MRASWRAAVALAALWLSAVCFSQPAFSLVDDEVAQIVAAREPASAIAGRFWFGVGRHEHPPLSDLLLHFWLPVAGDSPVLLRLPSALFFLAGVLLIACAARRIAGPRAFLPAVLLGLLSPYNFHFARLAGWYSVCFFLTAWLTLAWLRYSESPDRSGLCGFIVPAILIVYANYFGWALVGLLLLDGLIRVPRFGRAAALTVGVLIVAHAPLWPSLLRELARRTNPTALVPNLAVEAFAFYTLFVGVSVAPWVWALSIPVGIAILLALRLLFQLTGATARRLLWYFAVAFTLLALMGKADNKRSLFLTVWLLIAVAAALAHAGLPVLRSRLTLSLAFIALLGWTGIVARRWYSAPAFLEPWSEVAARAADSLQKGDLVVSNSSVFLYYLDIALNHRSSPAVYFIGRWRKEKHAGSVLFVRGVNQSVERVTDEVTARFQAACALLESDRVLPDSGSALKQRLFPQFHEPPWRISIQRYRCPAP